MKESILKENTMSCHFIQIKYIFDNNFTIASIFTLIL